MYILAQETDGKPYKVKNGFICKEQEEGFIELLERMSQRPQDYVTTRGRMTTNAVEGLHGLALMYHDTRTDLGHEHSGCKTNMALCHKVSKHYVAVYMYDLHINLCL